MSNQVYSNQQDKYAVSKTLAGYYRNVSSAALTYDVPTVVLWTNTLGDQSHQYFDLNAGVLTCNRNGLYSISANISVFNITVQEQPLSFEAYLQMVNKQFTSPGFAITSTINHTGATTLDHRTHQVSLTSTIYCEVGDELRVYVTGIGSSAQATNSDGKTAIFGEVTGEFTNIIFTTIL